MEADYSPPINVEIKNEWSCNPPHPSVCLNGLDRDKFTFTFTNRSSARNGVIKPVI
jgi:hypothetical protein